MATVKDFVKSLQNISKIEINDTTNYIEKTIKDTFASIETQLISKIKTDVQDELIKKLSGNDTEDSKIPICNTITKDSLINEYMNQLHNKDEVVIQYVEYVYSVQQYNYTLFIAYTNYNNIYKLNNCIPGHDYFRLENCFKKQTNKNIKITKSLIFLINEIWKCIIGSSNLNIHEYCNAKDIQIANKISIEIQGYLTCNLPNMIYEFQKKYYANNKFSIHISKFEEIVNQYYKTKKELKMKNEELEKAKEEISKLKEENKKILNDLENTNQIKPYLPAPLTLRRNKKFTE